jgi:hypothetical protein
MHNPVQLPQVSRTGLPNPTFRNQEFFVKNQQFIRRFFSQKSGEKSGAFF